MHVAWELRDLYTVFRYSLRLRLSRDGAVYIGLMARTPMRWHPETPLPSVYVLELSALLERRDRQLLQGIHDGLRPSYAVRILYVGRPVLVHSALV